MPQTLQKKCLPHFPNLPLTLQWQHYNGNTRCCKAKTQEEKWKKLTVTPKYPIITAMIERSETNYRSELGTDEQHPIETFIPEEKSGESLSEDQVRKRKRREYYQRWYEKKKETDPEWVDKRREYTRRHAKGFRVHPEGEIEITKEAREIWKGFGR